MDRQIFWQPSRIQHRGHGHQAKKPQDQEKPRTVCLVSTEEPLTREKAASCNRDLGKTGGIFRNLTPVGFVNGESITEEKGSKYSEEQCASPSVSPISGPLPPINDPPSRGHLRVSPEDLVRNNCSTFPEERSDGSRSEICAAVISPPTQSKAYGTNDKDEGVAATSRNRSLGASSTSLAETFDTISSCSRVRSGSPNNEGTILSHDKHLRSDEADRASADLTSICSVSAPPDQHFVHDFATRNCQQDQVSIHDSNSRDSSVAAVRRELNDLRDVEKELRGSPSPAISNTKTLEDFRDSECVTGDNLTGGSWSACVDNLEAPEMAPDPPMTRASTPTEDAEPHVALFEEWSGTVQVCTVDGKTTFQGHFEGEPSSTVIRALLETFCAAGKKDGSAPKRKPSQSHKPGTVNRRLKRIKFADSHDDDADIYTVERILARRKDKYLILWEGYEATTWEPSCNIIDKGMLRSFEAGFELLDDGVEVLDARMIGEQQEYYITWQGRPKEEAEWVIGTEISQDCISRYQKSLDKNAE